MDKGVSYGKVLKTLLLLYHLPFPTVYREEYILTNRPLYGSTGWCLILELHLRLSISRIEANFTGLPGLSLEARDY